MKARWLTLFAFVPLIVGTTFLVSCGGVGGPTTPAASGGSTAPTQNFLALLPPEQSGATYVGAATCGAAACHGGAPAAALKAGSHGSTVTKMLSGPETGQYTTWNQTLHAQKGVTCESCHGPGSVHANNPTKSDGTPQAILTFPSVVSQEVCGQCHGPIHDDYNASKHSQLIPDPINSAVSNPSTAATSRCFICHGGLARAQYTENGIDPSTLSSAQILTMANSILNTVPQSADCTTCHDPHAKTGNLDGDGQEDQLYHKVALTDPTNIAPGSTVLQYTAVNQICGQCHNGRGTTATDTYLTNSTSRPSVHHSNNLNSLLGVGGAETPAGPPQRSGTHALAPGQCTTCHMPSGRHTMTVSYEGCAPCHTTSDAAARAATLKAEVINDLTALSNRMGTWATTNLGGPTLWDYTSNILPPLVAPKQSLIPIQVKRARHNYYYVVTSGDYGVHNPAYTRYLLQWASDTLTQLGLPQVKAADIQAIPMAQKEAAIRQVLSRPQTND